MKSLVAQGLIIKRTHNAKSRPSRARLAAHINGTDRRKGNIMNAHKKGYDAYLTGKRKSENPYEFYSDDWYFWRNGWEQAQQEQ